MEVHCFVVHDIDVIVINKGQYVQVYIDKSENCCMNCVTRWKSLEKFKKTQLPTLLPNEEIKFNKHIFRKSPYYFSKYFDFT